MKKLVSKKHSRWFMLLLAIMLLAAGYVGLRYYVKPEWFDQEHVYHKVYNYQVKDIEPQKKIIKDLNVEIIHNRSVPLPDDREFKEETREIEPFYGEGSAQLHVTFTDDTQAVILLDDTLDIGPSFDNEVRSKSLYQKLVFRFPNYNASEDGKHSLLDSILLLYPGDTLYQITSAKSIITYQLENPKTKELQTYYEYASKPDSTWKPIFFLQSKGYEEENQGFFDDYEPRSTANFYDRKYDYPNVNKLSTISGTYYYRLFYSDNISNLPLGISTTGNTFKMTITETYIVDSIDDDQYRVKSSSKTYTEENRAEYISEVLEKY